VEECFDRLGQRNRSLDLKFLLGFSKINAQTLVRRRIIFRTIYSSFLLLYFFSNTISKKNAFSAVSLLNKNEILLPDLIGFCRGFAHTTQDNTISLFLSFSNV
jgi:hypothetical protein